MRRGLALGAGLIGLIVLLVPGLVQPRPAAAGFDAGEAAPALELLDAGAAPRRVLRMQLTPGSEDAVRFRLRVAVGATLADTTIPKLQAPEVDSQLQVRVESVDEAGVATLALAIDEVEAEPMEGLLGQLLERSRGALERLRGVECRYRVTRRGFAHDLRCRDGDRDDIRVHEQARESIRNAYVLLPEEPVGVGARWRATEAEPADDGATWVGEREFLLEALEGDAIQVSVETRRSLSRSVATRGPEAQQEVRTWARGRVDLDPRRPVSPAELDGGASYDTQLRTQGEGGESAAVVRMELDVHASLR